MAHQRNHGHTTRQSFDSETRLICRKEFEGRNTIFESETRLICRKGFEGRNTIFAFSTLVPNAADQSHRQL